MKKISEGLQEARDLIATEGWTKGTNHRPEGDRAHSAGYCARGAINKIFFGDADSLEEYGTVDEVRAAQRLVAQAMRGRFFDNARTADVVIGIYQWNDSRDTKKKHVLAAFDVAIAEAQRLEEEAAAAFMENFTIAPVMIELSAEEPTEAPVEASVAELVHA